MRKIGWLVASCAVVVMSVALVEGQQDDKKKAGGFQFGGGVGAGQRPDPLNILRNGAVKKELEVTDEQLEKLPAEVMNAISRVLSEKQMKRFRQIELQQQGNNGFKDDAVQTTLKITADQKKSIGSILDDSAKEIAEVRKAGGGFGGFGKGGKANTEKIDNINKETKEKIYGVLSAEQRKGWRAMTGDELKLDPPNFGGFGGFGKDKKAVDKKKTDTE